MSLNNTVCIFSISPYGVVFPPTVAIPQPAVIQDMEPETTCKLAMWLHCILF